MVYTKFHFDHLKSERDNAAEKFWFPVSLQPFVKWQIIQTKLV